MNIKIRDALTNASLFFYCHKLFILSLFIFSNMLCNALFFAPCGTFKGGVVCLYGYGLKLILEGFLWAI